MFPFFLLQTDLFRYEKRLRKLIRSRFRFTWYIIWRNAACLLHTFLCNANWSNVFHFKYHEVIAGIHFNNFSRTSLHCSGVFGILRGKKSTSTVTLHTWTFPRSFLLCKEAVYVHTLHYRSIAPLCLMILFRLMIS